MPQSEDQAAYGLPSAGKKAHQTLSDQLNAFLQTYCRTYENRDLGAFKQLFARDARENGKAFQNLLPTYRKNFEVIEQISYQIHMANYLCDLEHNRINIEGEFFLEWQKKQAQKRNRYQGNIRMDLVIHRDSFLVKTLSYHFKK